MTTTPDPDLKTCIGCGRSYPATAEFFAKAGKDKRGETLLRPRCKTCHNAYVADNKERHGELRNEYDGGSPHRPPFTLPAGCALGHWRQVPRCEEGMGLPVLVGPGGRPVLRRAGVELGAGEVCIVLR